MTTERFPPVPPECDLRDFAFIPLEFERLFASDTWVLGNPEEKIAAVHLWCKSWHQVPAASLPDDDRMLAHLSAAGPRWKKLRQHALRGWMKCTDGRLYHPVVAEKALKAWAEKLERRTRTHNARVAALRRRIQEAATDAERVMLQAQMDALLQEPVTETKGREGKGSEWKEREENQQPQPLAAARGAAEDKGALTRPTREAYTAAYLSRWKVKPIWDRQANAMVKQFVEKVGVEEAPGVAEFFVAHNRQDYVRSKHDVGLMLRDARGLRTEWATNRPMTDTEARHTDRAAATGNAFSELIDEKNRTAA